MITHALHLRLIVVLAAGAALVASGLRLALRTLPARLLFLSRGRDFVDGSRFLLRILAPGALPVAGADLDLAAAGGAFFAPFAPLAPPTATAGG